MSRVARVHENLVHAGSEEEVGRCAIMRIGACCGVGVHIFWREGGAG